MLRLLFVAIVAVLVAESIQKLAEPTDAPDTTKKDDIAIRKLDGPSEKPETTGEAELLIRKLDGPSERPDTTDDADSDLRKLALPSDKPDTTKPEEIIIRKRALPSDEPDTTNSGLGQLKPEGLKPGIVPFPPHLPCYQPNIKCWTQWFDRDDPSGTGDWENLVNLRKENPGKICPKPADIEVVTLSGKSVAQTGEVIYKMDTTTGFVCRKKDQPDYKCEDYKVRFSCSYPYCDDGVCWTKWLDRDNPAGTGDWELLKDLRKKYKICESPLYIEVVTTGLPIPASHTGQNFYVFNPTEGFVCRNKDQKWGSCRDYKVRFGCKC